MRASDSLEDAIYSYVELDHLSLEGSEVAVDIRRCKFDEGRSPNKVWRVTPFGRFVA
jgi:hypothetical protein